MRRNCHRLAAIGLCWLAAGTTALACPICFQVEDANTVAGVRAGVIVLMSVTVVVLSAVAAFSIRIWRNQQVNRPDA
jgi:hypothetical protein